MKTLIFTKKVDSFIKDLCNRLNSEAIGFIPLLATDSISSEFMQVASNMHQEPKEGLYIDLINTFFPDLIIIDIPISEAIIALAEEFDIPLVITKSREYQKNKHKILLKNRKITDKIINDIIRYSCPKISIKPARSELMIKKIKNYIRVKKIYLKAEELSESNLDTIQMLLNYCRQNNIILELIVNFESVSNDFIAKELAKMDVCIKVIFKKMNELCLKENHEAIENLKLLGLNKKAAFNITKENVFDLPQIVRALIEFGYREVYLLSSDNKSISSKDSKKIFEAIEIRRELDADVYYTGSPMI